MKCKPYKAPIALDTSRLLLKIPSIAEVESVCDCWNLDGPRLSVDEATAHVERMLLNHEMNQLGTFTHLRLAIVEKSSGKYIGWCGIAHDDKSLLHPVVFCQLKKAYWGQGLATEASSAVLRFGLADLGLQRIDGDGAADNIAFIRVIEKIGMHYIGQNESGGLKFSVSRDEYLNQRSSNGSDRNESRAR